MDIFGDFYPDQAHFVFELLQNAEDTGATEAAFILRRDGCTFEHNGAPFTENDVTAITGINNSAKHNRPDKIGQFGIGFKSVFAYTLTPNIHSGSFSFKIIRLVKPEQIADNPTRDDKTRFCLPFDHPKKLPSEAFGEITSRLNGFDYASILFLSHLKSVRWQVEGSQGEVRQEQHSENHFEVIKQIDGKTTSRSHFLKFERPVIDLESQRVAVAFQLAFQSEKTRRFNADRPFAEQFCIVPSKRGRVAVYFSAEKETSGLRFHLHGPFVPELSRASIKETPANQPLFDQLAALAASALHRVREQGLLTREFLAVLPNPRDELPNRYAQIRSAVRDAMQRDPLVPTRAGAHAPATRLRQARASLKNLLSKEDLEFLCGEKPLHWAIDLTQENDQVDHFLEGLKIDEWDVDCFVDAMAGQLTPDGKLEKEFEKWLSHKTLAWHEWHLNFV